MVKPLKIVCDILMMVPIREEIVMWTKLAKQAHLSLD